MMKKLLLFVNLFKINLPILLLSLFLVDCVLVKFYPNIILVYYGNLLLNLILMFLFKVYGVVLVVIILLLLLISFFRLIILLFLVSWIVILLVTGVAPPTAPAWTGNQGSPVTPP